MRKAFISSATSVSGQIFDFKKYRQAAIRVVEIMSVRREVASTHYTKYVKCVDQAPPL